MKLIAVYGTLRRGCSNHYIMGESRFVGDTKTAPIFKMCSFGHFPAVFTKGNTAITVEIYEVDDKTLQRIYQLEGYTGIRGSEFNWYDTIDINTPIGIAEMFIGVESSFHSLIEIKTGDWKNQNV